MQDAAPHRSVRMLVANTEHDPQTKQDTAGNGHLHSEQTGQQVRNELHRLLLHHSDSPHQLDSSFARSPLCIAAHT